MLQVKSLRQRLEAAGELVAIKMVSTFSLLWVIQPSRTRKDKNIHGNIFSLLVCRI